MFVVPSWFYKGLATKPKGWSLLQSFLYFFNRLITSSLTYFFYISYDYTPKLLKSAFVYRQLSLKDVQAFWIQVEFNQEIFENNNSQKSILTYIFCTKILFFAFGIESKIIFKILFHKSRISIFQTWLKLNLLCLLQHRCYRLSLSYFVAHVLNLFQKVHRHQSHCSILFQFFIFSLILRCEMFPITSYLLNWFERFSFF